MHLPQAQAESLITRWVDGELVIIDEETHSVHCLADQAARVFLQCSGRQTPEQIASAEGLSLAQVTEALERLGDAGLLASTPSKLDLTRRAFAGRTARATALTALSAGAAPLVTSLLLPAAAHATSAQCREAPCTGASMSYGSAPGSRQLSSVSKLVLSSANDECAQATPACGPQATCNGNYVYTSGRVNYSGHCSS